MRITCVIGPFLPVPTLLGGAVEKIFLTLCSEFSRLGHDVTIISRRYKSLPYDEIDTGIHYIRLPSHNAPSSKLLYRLYDVLYAFRVSAALPASDITITHSVFLPLIIPRSRAGVIYVSVARFPKKHMGIYRRVDRLQAVSTHIAKAICDQSPSVCSLVKTIPNTISTAFAQALTKQKEGRQRAARNKEIIFVGRIAREKGIELLIRAFLELTLDYPEWHLVIVGPHDSSQGGDGEAYLEDLKTLSQEALSKIEFTGPVFEESELIERFRHAEIFVYPSIADKGEALPLAPLEAMACGCAVIVSQLDCFLDYLIAGENGLKFDHTDTTGHSLALELQKLMTSQKLIDHLVTNSVKTCSSFTPKRIAEKFLHDFSDINSRLS